MSASTLSQQVPLNRREFLTLAWLASLGFILIDIGGVADLFAMPVCREGQFGGSFTLGTAGEVLLPPGGDPINYPKGKFWISNKG